MSTVDELRGLDYSQYENRRRLNRTVAEALGYTVRTADTMIGEVYELVEPEGAIASDEMFFCDTPDEAWQFIPAYANDLNAADALLDELYGTTLVMVNRSLAHNTPDYIVRIYDWDHSQIINVTHDDKCIVRCLAYLHYIKWRETGHSNVE